MGHLNKAAMRSFSSASIWICGHALETVEMKWASSKMYVKGRAISVFSFMRSASRAPILRTTRVVAARDDELDKIGQRTRM